MVLVRFKNLTDRPLSVRDKAGQLVKLAPKQTSRPVEMPDTLEDSNPVTVDMVKRGWLSATPINPSPPPAPSGEETETGGDSSPPGQPPAATAEPPAPPTARAPGALSAKPISAMTESEIRDRIFELSNVRPRGNLSRESLIRRLEELQPKG